MNRNRFPRSLSEAFGPYYTWRVERRPTWRLRVLRWLAAVAVVAALLAVSGYGSAAVGIAQFLINGK